ncbi:FGGY family carbohydrate kinase [Glutamicibacter sp. MNS18]|uniref:xylulokinase n=1 Tax=Glutamicibacter sp. MNS18 TaxID=2989817 RepID=UPI0022360422|nr:FGGY family carbohydrate kinase [Glutamicibacter sp. MNS18]MCW4466787.1 FGGY family carbohydrate kinase [Glutamicibacter sp. MNS18]
MTAQVLGVDIGTTAIKAAVFDARSDQVCEHTVEYTLQTPRPGYVELEAQTYISTFRDAVAGVLQHPGVSLQGLAVLGLSTQGETMLCLDAEGKPLRPAIVWLDNRAVAESEEIEAHFGRQLIHRTTGQVAMDPIWPAAKILWLRRNEPEIFARTAKFVLLKDYIIEQLTGELVSEDSLLCSTILWNLNTREYWGEMLDYLGIDQQRLPRIAKQGELVGSIDQMAAARFGLPQGLPVSAGALDQACGALGMGNAVPGIFSESTGSALTTVTVVDELKLDEAGRVPCFASAIPGQYMLHTFSTGGMVMRWFRDEFCAIEREIEQLCGINAYYLIDEEVRQVPPGSDGLIVIPHLQGSGPPDLDTYARGVFFGLTLSHKKQHLSRGIMEGVSIVLRRMIESTLELGVEIKQIISLSGGSKSAAWCQIKSDTTQLPVHTLSGGGAAACRGAAIIAGVELGLWDSAAAISNHGVEFEHSYEPNADLAETYNRLYHRFNRLQESLDPLLRETHAEAEQALV